MGSDSEDLLYFVGHLRKGQGLITVTSIIEEKSYVTRHEDRANDIKQEFVLFYKRKLEL